MAKIDATPLLNAIYAALNSSSTPVYQHGETLPQNLPDKFYVLQPLFNNVRQVRAKRRYATQQVQVLCCATDTGNVRLMAEAVNTKLVPEKYVLQGTAYENFNGTHWEVPVTATAIT